MAQDVCVIVDAGDRARLTAITADRNRPQKHVQRARIILLSANRLPVAEVARQVIGEPTGGVALAGTLRPGRSGRPAGRQDPPTWQGAGADRNRGEGAGAHLLHAPGPGHSLDRPDDGAGQQHQPALGAAHLGCPSHPHCPRSKPHSGADDSATGPSSAIWNASRWSTSCRTANARWRGHGCPTIPRCNDALWRQDVLDRAIGDGGPVQVLGGARWVRSRLPGHARRGARLRSSPGTTSPGASQRPSPRGEAASSPD
jgi:hypothetical protein